MEAECEGEVWGGWGSGNGGRDWLTCPLHGGQGMGAECVCVGGAWVRGVEQGTNQACAECDTSITTEGEPSRIALF